MNKSQKWAKGKKPGKCGYVNDFTSIYRIDKGTVAQGRQVFPLGHRKEDSGVILGFPIG